MCIRYVYSSTLTKHQRANWQQDKPVIKALTAYLLSKATTKPSLTQLSSLLTPTSQSEVGLILTERLINMPSEITPPMYTLLLDEIKWALEEAEPYNFTHYLIFSKTYKEVTSNPPDMEVEDNAPPSKKVKKGKGKGAGDAGEAETFYFHAEDEVLHKHATAFGDFDYTTEADEGAADAKRTFSEAGIAPQGHLILVEAAKFADAVKAVEAYLNPRA